MPMGSSVEGHCRLGAKSQQSRLPDVQAPVSSLALQRKDACSGSDSQNTKAGVTVARKRRVHAQFNDLQECYLQKRRHWPKQAQKQEERDSNPVKREGFHAGLKDFQSVLSTFTRYRKKCSFPWSSSGSGLTPDAAKAKHFVMENSHSSGIPLRFIN